MKNCWSEDGFLFRNFKNGKSSITGYLEDYAHVIDAFISLYEITLDEKWLFYSKQLTHYCFDYFYNELKKVGIYSDINMLVGRDYKTAEGFPRELSNLGWKEKSKK